VCSSDLKLDKMIDKYKGKIIMTIPPRALRVF
jgi:hypothetical protein